MNRNLIVVLMGLVVLFGAGMVVGYFIHPKGIQVPVGSSVYNRTITFTDGIKVDDGELKLGGTAITATASEINQVADGVLTGSTTWDPPSLSTSTASNASSTTVTVTGAALGDYVVVSAPYSLAGVFAEGYVSSANTVTIKVFNPPSDTGSVVDLGSGTWRVEVFPK